jgi:hypothetical protein
MHVRKYRPQSDHVERSDLAKRFFKLDLRQDCDPGIQKLKGAVRTETYQRHYCQHSSLFCLLRRGGVVFTLASSSWQGAA